MSIRNAAKAIIIDDGKIYLNKCVDTYHGDYYSLPGGGQNQYETMHEAVIRECLEETGFTVRPVRFAALCEDISMDSEAREKHPDYAHKIYHIFICELTSEAVIEPTETDSSQVGSEWIDIGDVENIRFLPRVVGENIQSIIDGTSVVFLGSEHIDLNHG